MESGAERLGAAIHRRRRSLAMDIKRFAALVGVSPQTVRDLEDGAHPSPQEETLFKVDAAVQALSGTSEQILLGEIKDYPPRPDAADLELAIRIAALDDSDANLLGLLIKRLSA